MTGQPATKTPKLAHIDSNHSDRLVKKPTVKKVPVVPNFLHKGPPTSNSVGHLKWVTEGVRVKEEPDVIEIDDNTDTGIGLTYDQSDEGLSCTDMEKEQALIKKYFNLPSNQDVALSDEQLLQCYLVGKSAAENFISKSVISTMLIVFVYKTSFYAPPQKVAGYYVIPSELLSVCLSICPSIRPSVRQRLNIRVRSITLIPFEIISRNLV